MTLWSVVVVLSLITQPLMNSALQPEGVFFLFSGFSFIAFFFMYFFVPETRGLTEAEMKKLFYPGAKWGRKLRPGEKPFVDEDEKVIEDGHLKQRQMPQGIGDTIVSTTMSMSTKN